MTLNIGRKHITARPGLTIEAYVLSLSKQCLSFQIILKENEETAYIILYIRFYLSYC